MLSVVMRQRLLPLTLLLLSIYLFFIYPLCIVFHRFIEWNEAQEADDVYIILNIIA